MTKIKINGKHIDRDVLKMAIEKHPKMSVGEFEEKLKKEADRDIVEKTFGEANG